MTLGEKIAKQRKELNYTQEQLADILGVDYSDTMACGDGLNDLSMIEYAGLGVAMGNAQQAVKDAANALLGDKTPIDIEVAIVGNEDCSTGWDGAKSQDFTIPAKKKLTLKFINHGSKANNWNNWNLRVEDASDKEVFLLRSDNYALVSNDPNAVPTMDMPDIPEGADYWGYFIEKMDGASVVMTIDHSMAGEAIVEVVATATDGSVIMNHYKHAVSATEDIKACLVCDGSWFDMKEAFLSPSDVAEIIDYDAIAISVSGTPASIEVGSTDFWGKGVATVTYADNTSFPVDTADVNFVVPDLSTPGVKTILYSYSKTKEGAYGPSVAGYYTLQVVNPVVKLEVTEAPANAKYYVFDAPVAFDPAGLVVTATYADETTGVVDHSMLTFGTVPADGSKEVEISYVGTSGTVTVKCPVEVVKGTSAVGLPDLTTPWWTAFTPDKVVAPNASVTFKMMLYSTGTQNYHSPCTILRQADLTENAVVRMDNFGWGAGYDGNDTKVLESNWNWETFMAGLNHSTVEITVTNNGDDTADIKYVVTYANGEEHFQNYLGVKVNSADLQTALVTEGSYLVLYE